MMGKYKYVQPNPWLEDTERKVKEMNNIANELAEANRLKRLELAIQLAHDEGGVFVPDLGALKDKT